LRGQEDRTREVQDREGEYHILIVDDDAGIRETLQETLLDIGRIEVTCVGNGEAGFSLIRKRQFDLIFIDVRLPGMDGLELLRLIKHHDPTLIVVMITGFPSVDSAIQTMKDGAADFITKPFRFQQIEHVVQKQLFCRPRARKGSTWGGMAGSQDRTLSAGR